MTRFLDVFRRPSFTSEAPTPAHLRRNDWILAFFVAALLALGWWIGQFALDNSRTFSLGEGLPTVEYPGTWAVSTPGEPLLFSAYDPAGRSTFSTAATVEGLPVRPDDTLDAVRAGLALRRSRELERYRELGSEQVIVLDSRPALLITYGYVADPTRESGAIGLPVVVQAQDLVFLNGNQWLVVTTAADAAAWESELPALTTITGSLNLSPRPESSTEPASEGTQP